MSAHKVNKNSMRAVDEKQVYSHCSDLRVIHWHYPNSNHDSTVKGDIK